MTIPGFRGDLLKSLAFRFRNVASQAATAAIPPRIASRFSGGGNVQQSDVVGF